MAVIGTFRGLDGAGKLPPSAKTDLSTDLANPVSAVGKAVADKFAAKTELTGLATKSELTGYATKADLDGVGGGSSGAGSVIDALTTSLDTRDPRPLVVAQASDSTGDAADEWFEMSWRELLAEKWPERPAQVYRWVKSTDTYTGPGSWQTAASPSTTGTITFGKDTFTTDRANLNGTSDESGHTWTTSGASALTVSGGFLRQPASELSYASLPLGAADGIDGTTHLVFKIASTGATQQVYVAHTAASIGAGNRLQVQISGTGGATPVLQQVINGTTTALATWPTNTLAWATELTVDVAITVAGTGVSATINGATVTATIDPALFGKAVTYLGFNNAQGVQVDSFERTGVLTEVGQTSNLGYLTAYNGAWAGGVLQHNLDRMNAMYPVRPDVLFINHGHNYTGLTTPDVLAQTFVDFVAAFHAKYSGVPVVVLSQNPKFAVDGTRTAAQAEEHAARQRRLRKLCKDQGWGYIPGLEAFMALADGGKSLVQPDGVHPITGAGAGTGSRLQADVAKAWISSQSLRP